MPSLPCFVARTALLTVCCLSLLTNVTFAQSTRISRSDIDRSRPLPTGGLGTREELRPLSSTARSRTSDYSKIDRRAVATLLRDALDESGRLYAALDADYRRNPQLRSLLADLGRLRAQTNSLNQDLAAGVDLNAVDPATVGRGRHKRHDVSARQRCRGRGRSGRTSRLSGQRFGNDVRRLRKNRGGRNGHHKPPRLL